MPFADAKRTTTPRSDEKLSWRDQTSREGWMQRRAENFEWLGKGLTDIGYLMLTPTNPRRTRIRMRLRDTA